MTTLIVSPSTDVRDLTWLEEALARWLHRTNLETMIPDFIALGEARLYRKLRIRAMEVALNETIAAGVVAVPAAYLEMKQAYIVGSPVQILARKSDEWIYANYPTRSADGKPKFFAREANNFIFGPYPDDGYTVKGVYYQRLTSLSHVNTSNWLTENAPDLLLYAALCEAAPYCLNDIRIPIWEGKYAAILDDIQNEDEREAFSGSPLSMTAR